MQVADASLSLSTYPGLKVTGIVGRAYRIESSPGISGNWSTETILVLPSPPYLWIDTNAVNAHKLYRAYLLP